MAFAAGVFSLVAGNPVVTGTTISSTWANNTLSDISANGLSLCVLKDGSQTITANIPMNSFKLTGLSAGSANGDSIRWQQSAAGVLTTTGDTLYASSANTPARLAVGAADLPLVVNSGATAPQWGFATKTANFVYAGPASGAAAAPAFRALVGADGASLVLISSAAAAASATIDFTSGISSTYDEYVIAVVNMKPATNNTDLWMRVSQDGGGTFKAGASDYGHERFGASDGGSLGSSGSTGDTQMVLIAGTSSTSTVAAHLIMRFYVPADTATDKYFLWDSTWTPNGATINRQSGAGIFILNQAAIDGIRFLMSSGNITSGNFYLYGVRKA